MSEEQLKAFISKAQEDTALREQLNLEGAQKKKVVAIANAAGFSITVEDLAFPCTTGRFLLPQKSHIDWEGCGYCKTCLFEP